MKSLRRRLAGFACLCVLSQVSAYAFAPAVLEYANALDRQNLPECCKLHGPHDVCPMDLARAANRRAGAPRLLDPCCSLDAAVLTLFGAVGIVATSARALIPDRVAAHAAWTPTPDDDLAPLPTTPPPRH